MRIRYTIQHKPHNDPALHTLPAVGWSFAAHLAVNLARTGSTDVEILRFDPDRGWSICGVVRRLAGRAPEPCVPILDDLRSDAQKRSDRADLDARSQTAARRVRGRFLGVAPKATA